MRQHQRPGVDLIPVGGRIIASVFGFVFFGVGVTVLVFLWGAGDGPMGPPLFFRIFGSFIALAFVTFGGVMCVSGIVGGKGMGMPSDAGVGGVHPTTLADGATTVGKYVCRHCGAPLGEKADVSPLGDVKCTFCGAWFNIHGKTA